MQGSMQLVYAKICETYERFTTPTPGCIVNMDLMSYRRIISHQNWTVHDFYKKWMAWGPGKLPRKSQHIAALVTHFFNA